MEAYRTRAERKRWAKEIEAFEANPIAHMYPARNEHTGGDTTESMHSTEPADQDGHPKDKPLTQLLHEAGYSTESGLMVEAEAYEDIFVPQAGSASSETGSNMNNNTRPTSPPPDPTLPQNRPNEVQEPFPPPVASQTHDTSTHSSLAGSVSTVSSLRSSRAIDPTLPQNRPNTPDLAHSTRYRHETPQSPTQDPEIARPSSSLSSSTSISSSSHNQNLPLRLRFQGASSRSPEAPRPSHTIKTPKRPPPPSAPPSPKTLARWTRLNAVEREARERAGNPSSSSSSNWIGPAKLNFEEFGERMRGDRGRRLGFVGSWVEMASF